ncbi:MAG: cyclic-di-GMP-binding protein [Campylobacterota bacterium]|nr:cyclic-di-GMP-binding protein [Campylobacterota bacterium]
MAKEHSFDISAKVDIGELKNVLEQSKKEVETRYDFKDSTKDIEHSEKNKTITIISDSSNKVEAIYDILLAKAIKRNIPPVAFEKGEYQTVGQGKTKIIITIKDTLSQKDAKDIIAKIKESKIKVQTAIQGDDIRVKAKSIDDLQQAIALVKSMEIEAPIVFDNFR